MRIVLDENLPSSWKAELAQEGHEAWHWLELGKGGTPDEIVFEKAAQLEAVLLTQDLDFGEILARTGNQTPSVIQLRVESPIPQICGRDIRQVLREQGRALAAGCLITYDGKRHRIRLLPL
ncbi:MAG: DUF5615 family PIN-like protein [Verrucomicrobiota bacterium JB022]|nr:DUF5615 family PIN-like protein [Verrucomicrobiota bacterium JB022]